jgi:bromodomain-containing protein 4
MKPSVRDSGAGGKGGKHRDRRLQPGLGYSTPPAEQTKAQKERSGGGKKKQNQGTTSPKDKEKE